MFQLGKPVSKDLTELLDNFIANLEKLDASPVTSAGNDGDEKDAGLHKKVPASEGTDDNALITVGAVTIDGDLWKKTTPHVPGQSGSITVYAQGSQVETYDAAGKVSTDHSGTSLASPAIVSLERPHF